MRSLSLEDIKMTNEFTYYHASGDSLSFSMVPNMTWPDERDVAAGENLRGITNDPNKCLRTIKINSYITTANIPTINRYMKPDVVLDYDVAGTLQAAVSYYSAAYHDETTDANDDGAGDVIVCGDPAAINDAFYIGTNTQITLVYFDFFQYNAGTVEVTWEYYNGASWEALEGVDDGTAHFTADGYVSWILPPDWEQTTINSQGPYYYMRARVTTGDAGPYNEPLATRVYVYGQYPYCSMTLASGTTISFPCVMKQPTITKSNEGNYSISFEVTERTL